MATIQLSNITKQFGDTVALQDVNLQIADGEFVVFIGPSGCGKSTLLRIIAGLESPTSGQVIIDGEEVTRTPAAKRGLSMVFQSYGLYPHMNVWNNMAFGLKMAKLPKPDIESKVLAVADMLELKEHLYKKPGQLSGGQRQRVAIGRAIVREPRGFLFDEPLSNLDASLRVQMRLEIVQLQRNLATTAIYVTHDQVEAMTMATRIVVLKRGKVEQVGTPLDVYNMPVNQFVAGFIGSPKMNFIGGAAAQNFGATTLGIRPEHLSLSSDGDWHGEVENAEYLGADTFLHVRCEGVGSLVVRVADGRLYPPGERVSLKPDAQKMYRFAEDGNVLPANQ
ncbi:MAG: ABC transporter ATP-binding protein [Gammaproteobacteria bacterium WSBS_2016_MAG_OTU1]